MNSLVFIVGTTLDRAGAHEDIPTITNTFETLFNAEVHVWTDLNNRDELSEKFNNLTTDSIWREKFRNANFVAVICMAHGGTDGMVKLYTSDEIDDIKMSCLNPFFGIKELDQKLKWLVVQSCRGDLNDSDDDLSTDGDEEPQYFPDHYYISYCTAEGTISWQMGCGGKVYLQKLCEELKNNAKTENLSKMLTNVADAVENYAAENNYKNYSVPCFTKSSDIDYKFFE